MQLAFWLHCNYLPNSLMEQACHTEKYRACWKCLNHLTKVQTIPMDREIVTTVNRLKNTIHHCWYHCWWNTDKWRQTLLELAISGIYRNHYLWLLTQSYFAISKNPRRQAKKIFVGHPKERADLKTILDQSNILIDDELVIARNLLKKSKLLL